MPVIECTDLLKRYFPELTASEVSGTSLYEIVMELDARHPGIAKYILDDQKAVRKHVAVAIDGAFIREKEARNISIHEDSNVLILQALSGG